MTQAMYYEKLQDGKTKCFLCPHHCVIPLGKSGICNIRINNNGTLIAESYGKITALSLDPIEKKPLYHFYPTSKILSIGSNGCNFRCDFCQNYEISMGNPKFQYITPEFIANKSEELIVEGNIGVAYTYNEPLINYEFVFSCAKAVKEKNMKNVLVTNGFISLEPLENLLPFIDAMNIDLKSFNSNFYKSVNGQLESVKEVIKLSAESCHIEITTLIIPGENDSEEEMGELSYWLKTIDENIPLHINRFFPRYKMTHLQSTPIETIYKLKSTAIKNLKNVYCGNCN